MLCEVCKQNMATTHIKMIQNGKVTEKYLCPHCAAKKGIEDEFGFNNAVSSMLTSIFGDNVSVISQGVEKHCECCGSSFNDILSSGKLGCSECYTTFFDQLLPYFKRVHGSVKHIGKSVSVNREVKAVTDEKESVNLLKEELKELIKQEKFEEAAIIRDKIKSLEGDV